MKRFLPILLGLLLAAPLLGAISTNAPAEDAEAKYTKDIENRTQNILTALALEDTNKVVSVHDTVIAQWRALRTWHDANDAKLKKNKDTNEVATVNASLKTLHNEFIAKLSKDLTPAQVDVVKDKMTYGVVQVTYNAYCRMYPNLTDADKKQIMDWLVEARETSMDQGNSNEKHAVFGKYKGRINNYLSKRGFDTKSGTLKLQEPSEPLGTNQPAK